VRELNLEDDPLPQMYLSIDQFPSTHPAFVARGRLPSAALLSALQAAVRAVDPSQAIFHVRMMDEVVQSAVAPRRTNTLLIALFAALAFGLASLGVYAVVAHGVAQRSREFGIRAALGANGYDLVTMVSREMAWVVLTGIATGVAGAWLLARAAASLLYGITTHDPATFVTVPLVLGAAAALATILPARRALRVNPAEVMRAE
jgi:putative ABC transport system permease protein